MRRVLFVIGTRPEVIKLAPVILELKRRNGPLTPLICSTGQHRGMLDQMMGFFGLVADVDLALMRDDQTPTEVAARAISLTGQVVAKLKPDWVVVQGDTTTAMAASIAAFYARARVAHVEAGLRTSDVYSPFPEELNRRIITRVASLHFAPTVRAAATLRREGVTEDAIETPGNTVIDALFATRERLRSGALPTPAILDAVDPATLILATLHRRENFDGGIARICAALRRFAEENSRWTIILPVHPNPAVRGPVNAILSSVASIRLTEPLGYPDFIAVMDRSAFIVTDSGGVQEEGTALGKPIVILRDETERPEAVANGNAVLTGSNEDTIHREMTQLARNTDARSARSKPCATFGDGRAAARIADALEARAR